MWKKNLKSAQIKFSCHFIDQQVQPNLDRCLYYIISSTFFFHQHTHIPTHSHHIPLVYKTQIHNTKAFRNLSFGPHTKGTTQGVRLQTVLRPCMRKSSRGPSVVYSSPQKPQITEITEITQINQISCYCSCYCCITVHTLTEPSDLITLTVLTLNC